MNTGKRMRSTAMARLALAAALLATTPLAFREAVAETIHVTAERVFTSADAGIVENGAVLIEDGDIVAVGPAASVAAPEGARRLTARVVLPGLIDSHTLVGVNGAYNIHADQDAFEAADPAGAEYRVLDSFNPAEDLVGYALSLGTTAIHVTPQPTAPIGGASALFKTVGTLADEMLLAGDVAMLFNLGEAPKNAFRETGPGTRMATAALIRAELHRAREWAAQDEDEREPDLALEALAKVLSGDTVALFTAHREDDIATALRIAREFEFEPVINYGTEAYLMRRTLRDAGAFVVLAPAMQRVSGMEKRNTTLEAARLLENGGVPFVLATGYEAYVPKSRVLLWEAAMAVAHGLDPERAIRAATIDAARRWGVADRIGSLEPGKDADLVLFDGDPFEYTTHVTHVLVDGRIAHEGSR